MIRGTGARKGANVPALLKDLVLLQDRYIGVLGDELDDVIPLAFAHGWRSGRYEEGKALREEIAKLKEMAGIRGPEKPKK